VTSNRCDRGAAEALSLVLIAPVVIGLALLVVSLGRGVDARAQVRTAAESAAQAAALERTPSEARAAAERAATAMLVDRDTCAPPPTVVVDTSEFRPGGVVAVTVSCSVSNRGVEVVQPTSGGDSATAWATIEQYRAGGVGP
jgi:Flp pilus assembly protein TadG